MIKLEPSEWYARDNEQRAYYMYEAVTSIAESLNGIATSLAKLTEEKPAKPQTVDWLDEAQRENAIETRRRFNYTNALDLWPDKLYWGQDAGKEARYYEQGTDKPVTITAYGWVADE